MVASLAIQSLSSSDLVSSIISCYFGVYCCLCMCKKYSIGYGNICNALSIYFSGLMYHSSTWNIFDEGIYIILTNEITIFI